jgi:AmiR/NasT family two-component response regulator
MDDGPDAVGPLGQSADGSVADMQQHIQHLETALKTCRRIGVALGILMHSRRVTEMEAFGLLRETSQRRHRKLRDIADEVVFTGTLD